MKRRELALLGRLPPPRFPRTVGAQFDSGASVGQCRESCRLDLRTTQIESHASDHQGTYSGDTALGPAAKPGVRTACTGSHDGECRWFPAPSISPDVETSRQ